MTHRQLSKLLNKEFTIPVEILAGTFPNNRPYRQLRGLAQSGFKFTGKELLHAIGSKTAALPANNADECINSAYLYANILDFDGDNFGYKPGIDMDSDLQTNRSNEIGIGIGCLLANKYFNIDWDTLESIKGQRKRFDYRAKKNSQKHVYEFKGTKHRRKQTSQIDHGLEKKEEMHDRGENYNVELIISTFLGHSDEEPRIILADPPFEGFSEEYSQNSEISYSFRHLSRLAQFIGNTPLSRILYLQARKLQVEEKQKERNLIEFQINAKEKESIDTLLSTGHLIKLKVGNENYIGRWVDNWLPLNKKNSKATEKKLQLRLDKNLEIFQGINSKLYDHIPNIKSGNIKSKLRFKKKKNQSKNKEQFITFSDGTIMGYRLKSR